MSAIKSKNWCCFKLESLDPSTRASLIFGGISWSGVIEDITKTNVPLLSCPSYFSPENKRETYFMRS